VLTLEQAIRKMTSLPAQRLGFLDRGLVRPGMAADLVCFDPETVRDTATYEDPRQLPLGIPYVVVNGRLVVDDGRHTGDLPGRALRRAGPDP
jgi:N-acyl-D-aspartate/D-glutamate deacylase